MYAFFNHFKKQKQLFNIRAAGSTVIDFFIFFSKNRKNIVNFDFFYSFILEIERQHN